MCRNSFGPCALDCGPEHAGDEELRVGEVLAEHRHERDRAALAHAPRAGLPKMRAATPRRAPRASHGAVGGAFQPVAASSPSNATRAPYGGSALEQRLQRLRGALSAVDERRQAQRELQRRVRPQHVARVGDRRQAVGAGDRQRRPPRAVEQQPRRGRATIGRVPPGERILARARIVAEDRGGRAAPARRARRGISQWNAAGSTRRSRESSMPVEQLARDAERRRHDAARVAGVHALGRGCRRAACRRRGRAATS